jgi:hypothetical protein
MKKTKKSTKVKKVSKKTADAVERKLKLALKKDGVSESWMKSHITIII